MLNTTDVDSIVIVAWPKGFVAHVRCHNPQLSKDVSAETKWAIYEKLEKLIRLYP